MDEACGVPSENSSAENPWGTEGYSRVEWWDSAANAMRSGCIKDSELSECAVSPSTQWDYAVTGYIGKTTEENAELRGGPRNDAIPTAALQKGSHLYVLGSAEGDWLYVSGYPFSSYLDDERSQEESMRKAGFRNPHWRSSESGKKRGVLRAQYSSSLSQNSHMLSRRAICSGSKA